MRSKPPRLDGWAGIRIEKNADSMLELIVEDNGGGPCRRSASTCSTPFFSGRSAGRGRGMGLADAWRLARQQGGDVRFDAWSRDHALRLDVALRADAQQLDRVSPERTDAMATTRRWLPRVYEPPHAQAWGLADGI